MKHFLMFDHLKIKPRINVQNDLSYYVLKITLENLPTIKESFLKNNNFPLRYELIASYKI